MPLFSLIPCSQEGTQTEEINGVTGKITATVTVRCAWENRLYLADDILLNRRVYPLIYTGYAPVAMSCSIVNGDSSGNSITIGQHRPPKTSLVTINYGNPEIGTTAFDAVAESIEPLAEFRRLPHTGFRLGSRAGRKIDPEEAPGFLEIKLRLMRRIYKLSSIPAGTLSLIGFVNDASYESPILGLTFAPETLLYDAPQPEVSRSSDGSRGYNLTQNLVYNPSGWNTYFDPDTASWLYYYRTGSTEPFRAYPMADFSGIL